MHITCRNCGAKLTVDLEYVAPRERKVAMGDQMLMKGTITVEDGSYLQAKVGVHIVNPDDASGMYLTSEAKRLAGCCGLDGCDGPNLLCKTCQTSVATKMTDCWMAHCVAFDPITTIAHNT